jgi:hypothetical protein
VRKGSLIECVAHFTSFDDVALAADAMMPEKALSPAHLLQQRRKLLG